MEGERRGGAQQGRQLAGAVLGTADGWWAEWRGGRGGVGSKVGSWSRTGNCTGLDGGEREASWFSGVSFHPSHHL